MIRVPKNTGRRTCDASFVEPAAEDWVVGVHTAVAQERPVAARRLGFCGIAFHDEDFFLVVRSLSNDLAKWVGNERIAPEFETCVAFRRVAFKSHAIHSRDV